MSVRDTKEKVFVQTIEMLKKDISSSQHEKVKEELSDVLRMMFYEDREPIKKNFSKHWSGLMTWLLTEKPLSPDVLIRYLKVIQNLVRKNYQRYSVNIDYYFNPDVFVKSFKTKGLLEKREKNIFLKQLLKDRSLTQEQVLMGKKTPTKVLEVQQERHVLKNMKDQLSNLRDAMIEEREMKIQEELDKTLDLLFVFQMNSKLFPEAKKLWYETLVWLLTTPNHSKNMKLKVLKMIQNKVRKLHKTSKKSYVEKVFPPEDFVYSMESGALSKRKNVFLSQVIDHLRGNYKKDLTVAQVLTPKKAQAVIVSTPASPLPKAQAVIVSTPAPPLPKAQAVVSTPAPPLPKAQAVVSTTQPSPKQVVPKAQVVSAITQPPVPEQPKSRVSLLSDIKRGGVALRSTKPASPLPKAQVVVSTTQASPKQVVSQAQVVSAITQPPVPEPPKSRVSLLSDIKRGGVALKKTKPAPQKGKLSVLSAIRTGGVKLKPATQRKLKQAQAPKQNQDDLLAVVRKGLAAKKGLSNVEQQDQQQQDDEWL